MKPFRHLLLLLALTGLPLGTSATKAEVTEVRFARQTGLGYLQLYLMQDLNLVEKQAKNLGLDVKATYTPLGQPSAINDALLSGTVDFAAAGITPFIILWDKTRSSVKVNALAALNSQPAFLNTNNPSIKSLKDFTDKDRIALPSVKLAYQATILEIAAEKEFGQYDKLDTITVGLSHADGTNALLSGKSEIDAHFTSPPYQYQQLEDPHIHRVLSSYDVLGGPSTFSGIWTTTKFHDDNPKITKAVLAAIDEANQIILSSPHKAADIFVRIENSKLTVDQIEKILRDPDIRYTPAPQNISKFTDFMARVGMIKKAPATWKELFFPESQTLPGS